MAPSRRTQRLLLTALLLTVPALLLRSSIKSPERMNPLDRVVVRLTAPLQGLLVRGGQRLGDAWSHYVFLVGVRRENERLLAENGALRAQLSSQTQLAIRAERLERLLELRSQIHSDTLAAQVIGVETSRQFRVLRIRIDLGIPSGHSSFATADEARPGLPVLAPTGIVGRILRLVGPFADVQLATDPRSSIDVVLPRTGSRGVLKGSASDTRYVCRVEYVVQKDDVQLGDVVLTSGLGGLFPRDIPVGKVVRLRKPDSSLYQEVEVEPLVDFGKLREVLVVLSPPPPPDPDAGKRPAEPLRGIGVPR
jgi:rod shape-determining protein MreC